MAALWQYRHNLSLSFICRQSYKGTRSPRARNPGAYSDLRYSKQTTRRKRKSDAATNGRQPDVKEVISVEDIYIFLLVPVSARVIFTRYRVGVDYLFIMGVGSFKGPIDSMKTLFWVFCNCKETDCCFSRVDRHVIMSLKIYLNESKIYYLKE